MTIQVYAYIISKLVYVVSNKDAYYRSSKGCSMYCIKGTSEEIVVCVLYTSLTRTETGWSVLEVVVIFVTSQGA